MLASNLLAVCLTLALARESCLVWAANSNNGDIRVNVAPKVASSSGGNNHHNNNVHNNNNNNPARQPTIAPMNAMAAAAINEAVKQMPAIAHTKAPAINAQAIIDSSINMSGPQAVASLSAGAGAPQAAQQASVPAAATTAKPAAAAAAATAGPTATSNNNNNSTSHSNKKLDHYFAPICDQLDKLQPKQMFKIQSQLKKFVELTNGKMSLCFAQHYAMEPNLVPVTKAQLQLICASRHEPANSNKVHFSAFELCGVQNWEASLDKELERINAARANCAHKHDHSKVDSSVSVTHEDSDDEVSLIGDVVSKVLGADGAKVATAASPVDKSAIKIIDMGANNSKPTTTTVAPAAGAAATSASPTAAAAAAATATAAVASSTTVAPATISVKVNTTAPSNATSSAGADAATQVSVKTTLASTTAAPKASASTTIGPITTTSAAPSVSPAANVTVTVNGSNSTSTSTTTAKPVVTIIANNTTAVPSAATSVVVSTPGSTAAPAATGAGSTSAPAAAVTINIGSTNAPTKAPASPLLDKKIMNDPNTVVLFVDETGKTTTKAPAATNVTVSLGDKIVGAAGSSTTAKPDGSSSAITISTSLGSSTTTTAKPASSSSTTASSDKQKEKDKSDTKKAIESLKAQKASGHGSAADERMHQIEHDRQMSLDPVGHTIKHKIYDMKKAGQKA